MKHFLTRLFLPCIAIVSLYSCDKTYDTIQVEDDQQIQTYMQQNNLTGFTKDTSGVYYKIVSPGQGAAMEYSDKIPLVITMKATDNSYSSTDTIVNHYADFLGYLKKYRLPEGIQIGVKEGLKNRSGIIRLIIPSNLAYGRNGGTTYFGQTVGGNKCMDVTAEALDENGLPNYDDISINKYMTANGLTGFSKTTNGIYYKISDPGTGSPITVDSLITATYSLTLLNGKIVDPATGSGTSTLTLNPLSSLYNCWQDIIPLIKEGGKVRFISPSSRGIGNSASGSLPAFSCLDFDVNVTDVDSDE